MFNIINNHPFFLKKNKYFILFNIFIYISHYALAIVSSFLSWNITYYNNNLDILTLIYMLNKKKLLILYYAHIITSIIIIFHLYNEINRELFYLYNSNNYINKKYNDIYYRISYILLIISYILNTLLSYIILNNNIYINTLFNSYLIISILFRTYSILSDINYSSSILFSNYIHYIRNTYLLNKKKIECFIDYPKDVYI
jgi:hypothetical protein